jgi:beta-glucosidase
MTPSDTSPRHTPTQTPISSTQYDTLIARLELPARVRLLTGASMFTLAPEPSIGLSEVRLSDGPTGVRGLTFSGGRTVALLPNATLLASTWSEDTLAEVGRLLAEEAMAQQIHVVLGPTINLHRSLLGGRLFEAYSEDPLLTGKLAAAYVRGMQASRVGACLKHLVANESETERRTMNSVVDEATLRELYLLPFEIATQEADPWSMMAAYNDVNGVAATEHDHVINQIVKGEWGYSGLVMSDWFATRTAAAAANGGLDLVMPGADGPWGDALVAAVRTSEVDESVIDEHLRRLLRLAERVGALGTPRAYPAALPAPDSAVRQEQLRRLAAQGMTVLTNRNAVLPLNRGQTVALIGRHAIETIDMGGGSAQVNPPYQTSIAQGLRALLGDTVSVTDGVEVRTRPVAARSEQTRDPQTGEPGVQFTLVGADGSVLDERHSPGATTLVGFDDGFGGRVASIHVRARVRLSGPVEIGTMGAGDWELRVGGQTIDYRLAVSGGGFGEEVLAPPAQVTRVELTGDDELDATVRVRSAPPVSGQSLSESDADASQRPMLGVGLVGLIARPAPRDRAEVIAEASRAAAEADVAVVVVGLSEEQETESVDKSTLRLPGDQDQLVHAVAAAANKTVVVVNAATPVLMPWLDEVDAVLWAGLPGQEGGHAVAAALLGDIEPAGRLVTTFPTADGATPAWSVTPVNGEVRYSERTFIGYRGHAAGLAPKPAFWFGHGLGYSTWAYSDASLEVAGESPTVSVTVTNTGSRQSREVVQVYFQPASTDQPVRLVGWTSVTADPGESIRAQIHTEPRMWRRWDTATATWADIEAGGQLMLARGLGDIRATLELPRELRD